MTANTNGINADLHLAYQLSFTTHVPTQHGQALRHCNKSLFLRLAVRMQTYMQNLLTYIPYRKAERKVPARRPMWAGMN